MTELPCGSVFSDFKEHLMMRADEEFAKGRFDSYLSRKITTTRTWTDGTQNAPPDYFLTADAKDFAVEVTTLMEMVNVGGIAIEKVGIDASRKKFVEKLEEKAISTQILNGQYIVYFGFIKPNKKFSWYRDQLGKVERNLLDYVRRTQTDAFSPKETFSVNNDALCSIEKHSDSKSEIKMGAPPITFQWVSSAEKGICELLKDALVEKAKKLSAVSLPKILLLLDENHFVENSYYRKCLVDQQLQQTFHTVLL